MPRHHKHRKGSCRRKEYEDEAMENALLAVADQNLSFRQAAERYGVPKSSLNRKFLGKNSSQLGRPPALSANEENKLVKVVVYAANCGYPLTKNALRSLVQDMLNRKGIASIFPDNLPGIDWVRSFCSRHKELSVRLCENVKRCRRAVNSESINAFFDNVEKTLHDVPGCNIINYDETNLSDDPGAEKVLVKRGSKHASRTIDSSKSSVSVMFAASGNGELLPLYVVYKATNLYPEWMQNGPEGCHYNRSKSGWFDAISFEDWFLKIALPYLRKKEGVKALIGDNLSSHISPLVLEKCEEHNIKFIMLLPNSTHVCQPLDVSFFRPLKIAWRRTITEWKLKHRGCIPKSDFPGLLRTTLESMKSNIASNLKAGFRSAGLHPINREEVLKHLPDYEEKENNDPLLQSFAEIVKNSTPTTQTTPKQKRRKLNVAPGKSVCLADLIDTQAERTANAEQPNNNESDDEESVRSSQGSPTASTSNASLETVAPDISLLTLDKFIVVKFTYDVGTKKEKTKKFVAKILKVLPTDAFIVSCMRTYRENKNIFIFPTIEDTCKIAKNMILAVLNDPKESRGRYEFKNIIL